MLRINADDLPRFMACNGSRLMQPSYPAVPGDNTIRDEGIAAHFMSTAAFNNVPLENMTNTKAPNGVFMTNEMTAHVADYLDNITVFHGFADFALRAMEVNCDHESVSGRADYAAFTSDQAITVGDFKYGYRIVEPDMNWTLISHCIKLSIDFPGAQKFNIFIFQPRAYHRKGAFRVWSIDRFKLNSLRDQLYDALANPSDRLNTSVHCGKCPANATCPAAQMAGMNAIEAGDIAHNDDIHNDFLSYELDILKRAADTIKARLEALQELAQHRITYGQPVPNYSLEHGLGKTRFKEGITPDLLFALTGKDLSKKELVTPAEAKRRGVNEKFLETVTERPSTGKKLVRITADDKARKLFGS